MIQLLIASPDKRLAERLRLLLAEDPEIRIAGECKNDLEQVSSSIAMLHPALLVMETEGNSAHCGEQLAQVHHLHPALKIILIGTGGCSERLFDHIVKYGIRGYLQAGVDGELLLKAVRAVATRGEFWFPRGLMMRAMQSLSERFHDSAAPEFRPPDNGFFVLMTRREQDVAAEILRGLTNKEIAKNLGITENTVKKHLKSLFAKLSVHHRSQLITSLHGERHP